MARSNEVLSKMYAEKMQATQQNQHSATSAAAAGNKPSAKPSKQAELPEESGASAERAVAAEDRSRTTTVDLGGYSMDIPKSFEEVYQLSQRNRQRNKDKRRGAAGEGDEEDGGVGGQGEGMDVDVGDSSDREDLLSAASARGASSSTKYDAQALKARKIDPSFYLTASAGSYKEATIDDTVSIEVD